MADRVGVRATLRAVGFTDEDLARPLIGVAMSSTKTMPCNPNQRDLAQDVKRGIRDAGGTVMEFNTIAVSAGVSMGGWRGVRGGVSTPRSAHVKPDARTAVRPAPRALQWAELVSAQPRCRGRDADPRVLTVTKVTACAFGGPRLDASSSLRRARG